MGMNKLISSILKNSSVLNIIKHLTTVVVKGNTAHQKQPVQDVYFQVERYWQICEVWCIQVFHVEKQIRTYELAFKNISIYNIHYFCHISPQTAKHIKWKFFQYITEFAKSSWVQAKSTLGNPPFGKKKTSSLFITYFKTMHLLQLVQRQLQAVQNQASLLEGKGNLYQWVNTPI